MKGKSVSVAPIKTNRAERGVIRLRGAEKFFSFGAASRNVCLIGKSQPDVTLDYFTELIDGNFQTAFRKVFFDLLLD